MRSALFAICLTFVSIGSSSAQVLNYVLQPGSYIRPDSGTFTDEPLTGSFQWIYQGTNENENGIFQLVGLSLTSPSFSIKLDPNPSTPGTDLDLLQSFPTQVVSVAGIVDLTGLFPSPALLAASAHYSGPADAPSSISISDFPAIGPTDGGLLIASLKFDAVLVPEPSTITLLALGCAIGLLARRRFASSVVPAARGQSAPKGLRENGF